MLLLIPFVVIIFVYYYKKLDKQDSVIAISSEKVIPKRISIRVKTYKYLPLLRIISILLLIIAISRPGKGIHYNSIKQYGIDIMIALDVSGSMRGEDFKPVNRLEVAKKVIQDFISWRKGDRIGFVIFAGEANLQSPLTVEHNIIKDIIGEINFDSVTIDGTAIGDAVALAASRMMQGKAKSKIILLLTDGVNNRGSIDPETAAKACAELGIKVYVVGIGKDGRVQYPSRNSIFGKSIKLNQFDESSLKKIAEITKAKFYRAKKTGVLWQNIKDINKLEKSGFEIKSYHEFYDKFSIFLILAGCIFALEIILRSVFFRKIP